MFISPSILLCGKNCLPSSEVLRDAGKKTSYIIIIIIIILKNVLDQNRTPFVKCMSSNFCLKTVSWSFEIEDFTLFDCSFASTSFLLEEPYIPVNTEHHANKKDQFQGLCTWLFI
ncbi:hypothetical protein Peur_037015 [Populus x canadensis]